MPKASSGFALYFRRNDFQLSIVGRSTILRWAALMCLLAGLTHFGAKIVDLF